MSNSLHSMMKIGRIALAEARGAFHPRSLVPAWGVAGAIAVVLGFCWWFVIILGGTSHFAPHWFYIPILLAGARFGQVGAAAAAVAAGLLVGPLAPADVQSGTSQDAGDWLSRGIFFLFIGQMMAAVLTRQRRSEGDLQRSHEVLRTMAKRLEPHRQAEDTRRLRISEITTVIEGGGIEAVFQPIVDLGGGQVVGVEALARFASRPGQSPAPLFAQAWEVGLGVEFEMTALGAAIRWLGELPERLWVSVNLSPDVIASEVFAETIPQLPLDRIVFEITEHARIEDYEAFGDRLLELRARGARLAIDDVGAGFASLRHIRLLRPEVIKMDRTLIQGIEKDPALQALASGLVSFGAHSGASVVAEGIENESELRTLRELDVSHGQGYLLARPSPLPVLNLTQYALAS